MKFKAAVLSFLLGIIASAVGMAAETTAIPGYVKGGTISLSGEPESQCLIPASDGSLYCVVAVGGRILAFKQEKGSTAFTEYGMGLAQNGSARSSIRVTGMFPLDSEGFFIEEDDKGAQAIHRFYVDGTAGLSYDRAFAINIPADQKIAEYSILNGSFDSRYVWIRTNTNIFMHYLRGFGAAAYFIPVPINGQGSGPLAYSIVERQADSSYRVAISRQSGSSGESSIYRVVDGSGSLDFTVQDARPCEKIIFSRDAHAKQNAIFVYEGYFKVYAEADGAWRHLYTVNKDFRALITDFAKKDTAWLLADGELCLLNADSGDRLDAVSAPDGSVLLMNIGDDGMALGNCVMVSALVGADETRIVKKIYSSMESSIYLEKEEVIARIPASSSYIASYAYAVLVGSSGGVDVLWAASPYGWSKGIGNASVSEIIPHDAAVLLGAREGSVLYLNESTKNVIFMEQSAGSLFDRGILKFPYEGARNASCLFMVTQKNGAFEMDPYIIEKKASK